MWLRVIFRLKWVSVKGQPNFLSSINQSQVNQVHYFWQELMYFIDLWLANGRENWAGP